MFTWERGQSFVMWAVVFGVVIAGIAMFFVPVKRTITSQVLHTTDHAVWGMWAGGTKSDVKQDGGRNWNQIGAVETSVNQNIQHETNETVNQGGQVATKISATSEYSSDYSTY